MKNDKVDIASLHPKGVLEKYANEHQKTIDDLNLGDHIRLFAEKN